MKFKVLVLFEPASLQRNLNHKFGVPSGAYTQIPTAVGEPSITLSLENPTQAPSVDVIFVKS